jgi:hypothetical protein
LKSRYITVLPRNGLTGETPTSIQVTIVAMKACAGGANAGRGCETAFHCPGGTCVDSPNIGDVWWAGPEVSVNNAPQSALRGAQLECTATPHAQVWTNGFLHLFGTAIVPESRYEVRTCDADGSVCSLPLVIDTGNRGDVIRSFGGGGQPNFQDIYAVVTKFQGSFSGPDTPRSDLVGTGNPGEPSTPNQVANFADVSACVSSFSGIQFHYTVPACP